MESCIKINILTGETEQCEIDITLPNPRIQEINCRMSEILELLKSMDYKTHKFIDGEISESDFEIVKLTRVNLRNEYNAIELELNSVV